MRDILQGVADTNINMPQKFDDFAKNIENMLTNNHLGARDVKRVKN